MNSVRLCHIGVPIAVLLSGSYAQAQPCKPVSAAQIITESAACFVTGSLHGRKVHVPATALFAGVEYAGDDIWSKSYRPHDGAVARPIKRISLIMNVSAWRLVNSNVERQDFFATQALPEYNSLHNKYILFDVTITSVDTLRNGFNFIIN